MTKYIALMLTGAAWMLTSCGPEMTEISPNHVPAVNGAKLAPKTDESGAVRAFVGTEVTFEGQNLDQVGRVTVDEKEAAITVQEMKVLKFKVPVLGFPQQEEPQKTELKVFDKKGKTIFNCPYYVTVPITDAVISGYAPAEGTVGTDVTLTGLNLEQITRVKFGTVTVEAATFVSQAAKEVKFAIPAGSYAEGSSDMAIEAHWGENTIDVTADKLFRLHTPRFAALAAQPGGVNSKIGDEIELTGENLDRVDAVTWGDVALSIVEQSAAAVKVKFPASIDKADPVVQTAALTASYGKPAQSRTLSEAWRLDTTPSTSVVVPSATSMTPEDGGNDAKKKFYLGKVVTVTGENLTFVEGIQLQYNDGEVRKVAAAIAAGATDTELKFTLPDGVTFSSKTEVEIVAIYNTTDEVSFGKANVYPFYYYKGIKLGLGSNSKNTYTPYAAENAFFYPDMNQVVSTEKWYTDQLDPLAAGDVANPAVKAASTLTKTAITEEDYYAIQPYVFFITNSGSKLSLAGCANSSSQIKTHCRIIDGVNTSLPSNYGTPIVLYRVVTGEDAAAITSGTHETMNYSGAMPSAGAPALAVSETTSAWVKGSVLMMSYSTYTKGGKPEAPEDLSKTGYIVIKEVTCADLTTGLANADRAGYIEFDMYWSKELNK